MTENRENHQHLCWTRTSRTAGNVDLRASARASLAPGERSQRRKWNWHENRRESALSWSTAEREVVSSQPSSTRVLKTWHSATTWDTEEPEDVSMLLPSWTRQGHSGVWQKSTISEKGWVFFFSMFVSLFVCWHYLERCVTAGNSETEIPEDDLVHFPDACPWHLHRSSQSKRFAAPCEDLFSFFFFLFLD